VNHGSEHCRRLVGVRDQREVARNAVTNAMLGIIFNFRCPPIGRMEAWRQKQIL
jgi:hypothetical protein